MRIGRPGSMYALRSAYIVPIVSQQGEVVLSGFRLVNYEEDGRPVAGIVIGANLYPLTSLPSLSEFGDSVLALLEAWEAVEPKLEEIGRTANPSAGRLVAEARLLAPILYPNAVYCAAANYRDHMRAMAEKLSQPEEPDPHDLNIQPYHFVVPGRSCVSGPSDGIRLPNHGELVDWEIELVAVIGKRAANVTVGDALRYVAAYTIGNDVSVRDRRFIKIPNVPAQSVFQNDFIGMKGFDGSVSIGPWLVPASEVPDPQSLDLELSINNEVMQSSSTAEMVFTVAEQISYLSSRVTLLPGDLLMTGTPAGTGMERDRFLREGEALTLRISGIGELHQTVRAA